MHFPRRCFFVLAAAMPCLAQAQAGHSVAAPVASTAETVSTGGCATTYSGTVEAKSQPLAGVSIAVKGTNILVITNQAGYFTLPASVRAYPTLSMDAMGYEPVVLTYRDCEPLRVEMKMLATTRVKKHGRRKGFIMMPPKR